MEKLDEVERRVIGSLMEKKVTTPDAYPLTMNSLLAACNQKTNRDPITDLTEEQVSVALDRLQQRQLVWRVMGGRSLRWDHKGDKQWQLDPSARAVITLLLLRGPQTMGELRNRSERMFRFESLEEVSALLGRLGGGQEPLVTQAPRGPGQKEDRFRTTLAGDSEPEMERAADATAISLAERLSRLEAAVERIEAELSDLKGQLGG